MSNQLVADFVPVAAPPERGWISRLEDRQFALMQGVFGPLGGLCESSRVERLLRPLSTQPISMLAHWIVAGRIVSFEHQGTTWIPMFQFEPASMQLLAGVADTIEALAPAFDEWELALWFASPNDALHGAAPAGVVARNAAAVLAAARLDRFVALG